MAQAVEVQSEAKAIDEIITKASGRVYMEPTRERVDHVLSLIGEEKARILSICSGKAVWEKILSLKGHDVVATDIQEQEDAFMTVGKMSCDEAVETLAVTKTDAGDDRRDVLFVCWPGGDKASMYEDAYGRPTYLTRAIEKFRGKRIIYIGEKSGRGPGSTLRPFQGSFISDRWDLETEKDMKLKGSVCMEDMRKTIMCVPAMQTLFRQMFGEDADDPAMFPMIMQEMGIDMNIKAHALCYV